jgi:hypothetical protein
VTWHPPTQRIGNLVGAATIGRPFAHTHVAELKAVDVVPMRNNSAKREGIRNRWRLCQDEIVCYGRLLLAYSSTARVGKEKNRLHIE